MRPSLTISSNSDGETPMYCAASIRDNPLGGNEGGRTCFIKTPNDASAERTAPTAGARAQAKPERLTRSPAAELPNASFEFCNSLEGAAP